MREPDEERMHGAKISSLALTNTKSNLLQEEGPFNYIWCTNRSHFHHILQHIEKLEE